MSRFCVDCRHHAWNFDERFARHRCVRTKRTNLVTGELEARPVDCGPERCNIPSGRCGVDGQFFEPKPPSRWHKLSHIFRKG